LRKFSSSNCHWMGHVLGGLIWWPIHETLGDSRDWDVQTFLAFGYIIFSRTVDRLVYLFLSSVSIIGATYASLLWLGCSSHYCCRNRLVVWLEFIWIDGLDRNAFYFDPNSSPFDGLNSSKTPKASSFDRPISLKLILQENVNPFTFKFLD